MESTSTARERDRDDKEGAKVKFEKPKYGDKRIIRKFLLKPVTIGRETRVMEWATVRQEYKNFGPESEEWVNVEFVDNKDIR